MSIERRARRRQSQYSAVCDRCYECERAKKLSPAAAVGLWGLLLLPSVAGFWLPIGWLVKLSAAADSSQWTRAVADGLSGSLQLSLGLVALLLLIGVLLTVERRANRRRKSGVFQCLSQLARMIYAIPGTVLAQGIFILALFITAVTGGASALITGGFFVLLLACASRFFIVADGMLETAMSRISPQLDATAKLATMRPWAIFFRVHFPLLRAALATAVVVIFLEGVKELPMTLILRPFNFDTLATIIYQYAADENLRAAAPATVLLAALSALSVSALFLLEGRDTRGNF